MKLRDAVAVITGASRGIGRATAVALAREGAHIVCAARSSTEAPSKIPGTVEETAEEVRSLGRRALAIPCDISREDQVNDLAARVLDEFGRIDVLVNNAAVNAPGSFANTSMKRWNTILNVNLLGAILCTRACLPQMIKQGNGRIINVSSGAADDPEITARYGILPYAVSKAALETLTRGLALELQPSGIAVNCLRIETSVASEGAVFLNPNVDVSGWERPETVADAILWLLARPASYTGRVMALADVRAATTSGT